MKTKASIVVASSTSLQDAVLVGGQKRNRPRKPPVCWKCGEVGHVQHFCPKDRSLKLDHKAKAANKEVPFDSDGDGIFAAGDDLPQMDKWLVDSGASSHMT